MHYIAKKTYDRNINYGTIYENKAKEYATKGDYSAAKTFCNFAIRDYRSAVSIAKEHADAKFINEAQDKLNNAIVLKEEYTNALISGLKK